MALRNILELSHLGIDFPETAKLFKKANAAEARSHLVLRVVPRRICHSNSGSTGAGASPHTLCYLIHRQSGLMRSPVGERTSHKPRGVLTFEHRVRPDDGTDAAQDDLCV